MSPPPARHRTPWALLGAAVAGVMSAALTEPDRLPPEIQSALLAAGLILLGAWIVVVVGESGRDGDTPGDTPDDTPRT